ncbi:MAG: hypothetical protein ACOC0R_02400, partial [Mariniphaga sp.]
GTATSWSRIRQLTDYRAALYPAILSYVFTSLLQGTATSWSRIRQLTDYRAACPSVQAGAIPVILKNGANLIFFAGFKTFEKVNLCTNPVYHCILFPFLVCFKNIFFCRRQTKS